MSSCSVPQSLLDDEPLVMYSQHFPEYTVFGDDLVSLRGLRRSGETYTDRLSS